MKQSQRTKNAQKRHKTQRGMLPGAVYTFHTRCGKPACRCNVGHLHGPYFVRRWSQDGHEHKAYVRPEDVERVRDACAAWQHAHMIQREALWVARLDARQLIQEIRRIERELIARPRR